MIRNKVLFWFTFPYIPVPSPILPINDKVLSDLFQELQESVKQYSERRQRNHLMIASISSDSSSQKSVVERIDKFSSFTKLRILLVDDSSIIRKMVCKSLKNIGYDVVAAANGYDALSILQQQFHSASSSAEHQTDALLDVVIVDLHMPVIDGYETIQRIRELERSFLPISNMFADDPNDDGTFSVSVLTSSFHDPISPALPKLFIVGCSANDDSDTVHTVLSAGANAFLAKPFSTHSLESLLQRYGKI